MRTRRHQCLPMSKCSSIQYWRHSVINRKLVQKHLAGFLDSNLNKRLVKLNSEAAGYSSNSFSQFHQYVWDKYITDAIRYGETMADNQFALENVIRHQIIQLYFFFKTETFNRPGSMPYHSHITKRLRREISSLIVLVLLYYSPLKP